MKGLLLCFLPLFSMSLAHAQPDERWSTLPIIGQFDAWYDTLWAGGPLFFSDAQHGYVTWWRSTDSSGVPPSPLLCESTDGGMSWSVLRRFVPVPHILDGQYGFATTGYLTTDGGQYWRRALDSQVAQLIGSPVTDGGAARYLVALRWLADGYVKQMVVSSDFGETWIHVDSVTTNTCVGHESE